ncbi:hypothetical protein ABIB57_004250 [Devosia sp. UYZn731]|uniref:hypothetical protein n=1 Tax=Devosia sp. UYZn731 TaxID=3156345 RepID=UPI003398DCAC
MGPSPGYCWTTTRRLIGTIDIDLSLRPEELGAYEYTGLVEALLDAGYQQEKHLRSFQLVRTVPGKDGEPAIDVIDVIVDFLMPRNAVNAKNPTPILDNFAVMRANGAELASRFYELVAIEGAMPNGGNNRVEIAVASIPALLAMKGYALKGRHKLKDAYDIYYCIRNFPGGAAETAVACKPVLETEDGKVGYSNIAEKFDKPDGTARAALGNSSRKAMPWATGHPISGSRMLSTRLMFGLGLSDCANATPPSAAE